MMSALLGLRRTVYIDDFTGICNRLETLVLAFALRQAYGHEIALDWPELDSFWIEETRRAPVRMLARLGATRLRRCEEADFRSLKEARKIILRVVEGPSERLDAIYPSLPSKIHLGAQVKESIRELHGKIGNRPLIGIHIRRGDFEVFPDECYDVKRTRHPAVPMWWYEWVMGEIVKKQKDACFLLSSTSAPETHSSLRQNFDVIQIALKSPYTYKGYKHWCDIHPVADLFGLAGCPVILATPISSFSHWAANVLGKPSICMVPLHGTTPADRAMGKVQLHGKRLPAWLAAGRHGENTIRLGSEFDGVKLDAAYGPVIPSDASGSGG